MATPTRSAKAKKALSFMESDINYEGNKYLKFKDDAPEWTGDLAREAHLGAWPVDHRFELLHDILEDISEGYPAEDFSPDVYTSDLVKWISKAPHSVQYINEAYANCGWPGTFDNLLMNAQTLEYEEVRGRVESFLDDEVEDEDVEDADEIEEGEVGE